MILDWTKKFVIACVIVLLLSSGAMFIISETKQALVIQFGEVVKVIREPGLKFKIPFIQELVLIDKRLLDFDLAAQEIIAGDQERVVVDVYTRYKITDPAKYFQTVQNESVLLNRLTAIVQGSMRNVFGQYPLKVLLSEDRQRVMDKIREEVIKAAEKLGLLVVDVRIRRTDLPDKNTKSILERMRSNRQIEANKLRAEGFQIKQETEAKANMEARTLVANANLETFKIRGEADAEAIKISAEAYNKDKEFFAFWRAMEAYKQALCGDNTSFLLSPDSDFFAYLNNPNNNKGK